MRVLHVVKTSDGADWAAAQVAELVKLGVEAHVVLPSLQGRAVKKWSDGGAILHVAPTDIAPRSAWLIPAALRNLRQLVADVKPDIIHSHFVSSTILLRLALGAKSTIPRLFQVPGPLHLEHPFWRRLELSTATERDSWIASSRCILGQYRAAGIAERRLYLSYHGIPTGSCATARTGVLRRRYKIPDGTKIVGNANFIYAPKWFLGQRIGIKAHEDVIDALGMVIRKRADVVGVLIGGAAPGSVSYEQRLRKRAHGVGEGRILMTGYLPVEEIRQMWPDFDIAVHVPISENCGGVGEPLLAGVPTIAGRVGGLPEVVIDKLTGTLVPIRQPAELARAILQVLDSPKHYLKLAENAQTLLQRMVSIERVASEVHEIYEHVLELRQNRPAEFDPLAVLSLEQHDSRLPLARVQTAN